MINLVGPRFSVRPVMVHDDAMHCPADFDGAALVRLDVEVVAVDEINHQKPGSTLRRNRCRT